jgi:hypothetical protein
MEKQKNITKKADPRFNNGRCIRCWQDVWLV